MKFILFLLMFSTVVSYGQDSTAYNGSICDFENILSIGLENRLNKKINKGLEGTDFRLLVVTASNNINELTIPRYLQRVFIGWGITKKELSKSVVLFISRPEFNSKSKPKLKLYVGKNTRETISRKQEKVILNEEIEPKFKKSDFKGAIKSGIKAILKFF